MGVAVIVVRGFRLVVRIVIVLIGGQYFDVSLRQYDALLGGVTPFEMNIDPLSDEDCEAVDNSTYWPED